MKTYLHCHQLHLRRTTTLTQFKVPFGEITEHRIQDAPMTAIDPPFARGAVIRSIGCRDNTLEILEKESIEAKVHEVTSAIRTLSHIGDPWAIVVQHVGPPGHFHLEGDVTFLIRAQRGIVTPAVFTDALLHYRAIRFWMVSKPPANRGLGRSRAPRIHK